MMHSTSVLQRISTMQQSQQHVVTNLTCWATGVSRGRQSEQHSAIDYEHTLSHCRVILSYVSDSCIMQSFLRQ